MKERALAMMALAALTATGWLALRSTYRRRLVSHGPAKPEALLTWEGEGGSLPESGDGVLPESGPSEGSA